MPRVLAAPAPALVGDTQPDSPETIQPTTESGKKAGPPPRLPRSPLFQQNVAALMSRLSEQFRDGSVWVKLVLAVLADPSKFLSVKHTTKHVRGTPDGKRHRATEADVELILCYLIERKVLAASMSIQPTNKQRLVASRVKLSGQHAANALHALETTLDTWNQRVPAAEDCTLVSNSLLFCCFFSYVDHRFFFEISRSRQRRKAIFLLPANSSQCRSQYGYVYHIL